MVKREGLNKGSPVWVFFSCFCHFDLQFLRKHFHIVWFHSRTIIKVNPNTYQDVRGTFDSAQRSSRVDGPY